MKKVQFDLGVNVLRKRVLDISLLFLLSAVVGIFAGLGAVGFQYLLQWSSHIFMDSIAGYRPAGPLNEPSLFPATNQPFSAWMLFLLPAVGGLISGLTAYFLAPEVEGHGTDAAIEAYHYREGAIKARVPFLKAITSAITIGTGGSAGREGPIAQIGAGIGSNIAQWLKISSSQRRILMAAGLGAGVGAIFRAPLAGAIFAAEVLYREMDMEHEVIAPAILSSVVAHCTFGIFFGWEPLFVTPNFKFESPRELVSYLLLALVVSLGARFYIHAFYSVRNFARKTVVPKWLRPAVGGLVVGLIGLFFPQALSTSFGVLQDALLNKSSAGLLLAIAIAKILTTSFTVGTGGSGGVFGPAIVIGGALGGSVGMLLNQLSPGFAPEPGAFVMVGMAGFFAAAAKTPISTVIMVSELTGNYHLLVPSMFVCTLGFLIVRRHSIYEKQVGKHTDSPVHQREIISLELHRLRVEDALLLRPPRTVETVQETTTLDALLVKFANGDMDVLPVVNSKDDVVGMITLEVLQPALGNRLLGNMIIAQDIAVPPLTMRRGENLYEALRKMMESDRKEILIIGPDSESSKVVDVLTSKDIIATVEKQARSAIDTDFSVDGIAMLENWFGWAKPKR